MATDMTTVVAALQAQNILFGKILGVIEAPAATSVGPTVFRPATPATGQYFFDTTVGLPIWWNGTGWINAAGGAV